MTEKTQADADVEAFMALMRDDLPVSMRGEDIIRVCGTLITTYLDGPEALTCIKALTALLTVYYTTASDDCDCAKCTENRRAAAH